MELFTKGTSVKLRSHHDKYLTADDDEESVRQSRNGYSQRSIWTVEMVPRKPTFIRLKSCHGKYLTASETSFLLGLTGKKVTQTAKFRKAEYESEWEPIRDDLPVKLMSWNGTYLRANGSTPPWRNSVTHDHEPYTPATKKWILWFVEVVKDPESVTNLNDSLTPLSSFGSSVSADYGNGSDPGSPGSVSSVKNSKRSSFGPSPSIDPDPGSPASVSSMKSKILSTFGSSVSTGSDPGSPASVSSMKSKILSTYGSLVSTWSDPGSPASASSMNSPRLPFTPPLAPSNKQRAKSNRIEKSAKESFHGAKTVRLRSSHDKYLTADDDEERVTQGRNGSTRNTRWTVEPVAGTDDVIRLKSCHGKYLTATNHRFLLGATGCKVVQSSTMSLQDPSVEWEPVQEGNSKVKLKSRNSGEYLRANGGMPPWRNSVTHDTPNRTITQDWVLWDVDVVEIIVVSHNQDGSRDR